MTNTPASDDLLHDPIATITELADIAHSILADADRLCDLVAEAETKVPDETADVIDRLHATAAAAVRNLDAVTTDLKEWAGLKHVDDGRLL